MVDPFSLYSATKSLDPTNPEKLSALSEQTLTGHFELSPHTSLDELVQINDAAIHESGKESRVADFVTEGDGLNDNIDTDRDNDNVHDKIDNDLDNDGVNDRIDNDMDNDGLHDKVDNDFDNDDLNDRIDADLDNDGLNDRIDHDRY